MGLAGRAARLQELVILSLQRERLISELAQLETRTAQLQAWEERLRALAPAARTLKAAGRPATALEEIGPLKRSAEQALKDFRADPKSVRRPDITAVNIFWRQASQRIETTSAEMRSEWERHVNRSMPEIQPAIVRALAGEDADAVESRLVEFVRQAKALAARLPSDDNEAAELGEVAREAYSVMEQFDLKSMPEEVQRFVEAALSEQATLGFLTPEVMSWLRSRGIEGKVRLSFAPTR